MQAGVMVGEGVDKAECGVTVAQSNAPAATSVQVLPWWGGIGQQLAISTSPTNINTVTCTVLPPQIVVTTPKVNTSSPCKHVSVVPPASVTAPAPVRPAVSYGQARPLTGSPVMVQSLAEGPITTRIPSWSSPVYDNEHVLPTATPVIIQSQGEYVLPHTQLELGHSMVRGAYSYLDPYFGGMVAAYGAQAMLHPHMIGVHPARMPLPSDMTEEEPVYVNAKQYNGILRRRQSRAKAESENKLFKTRKPYLHESRHLHAMRRARGCGGRFLNTKNKDEAKNNSNNSNASSDGLSSQEAATADSNETAMITKGAVDSRNQDCKAMQGLANQLMAGMGQSIAGSGYCSGVLVQSGHPIMSSGVPFGT